MPPEPHRWLLDVADVPHGGDAGPGTLDLSASLAPLGPSPLAVAAAHQAPVAPYPPRDARALVAAIAAELAVEPARIVAGAGAADLLFRALLAHLRPGDVAMAVAPCFGEYARAATACGARLALIPTQTGSVGAEAVAAVAERVDALNARVAILARPANPTGAATTVAVVAALIAATPRTRWIVDEAFIGLADDPASSAGADAVVVRSLTKELAIAGLRVAVAVAPPDAARAMRALAPPWAISAPALAAAVAGLADSGHRQANRAAVASGRAALVEALRAADTFSQAASANFVCFRPDDAGAVAAALRRAGIAVRRCDDLGVPGGIRIAVPPPAELARVVAALTGALRPARTVGAGRA